MATEHDKRVVEGHPFFDDTGSYLDRFGALLVLTILSVTMNALVNIDRPTESFFTELAWISTTFIVGLTLVLSLSASGVAKRPRQIATIIVGIAVVSSILISLFSSLDEVSGGNSGHPSLLWVLLAVLSPIIVTRRLFKHDRVTGETIAGAVAVFLLIALAFHYSFLALEQLGTEFIFGAPEPTTSHMYFSLVTITTLGYGDLSPVTEVSRYLATAEAVIGTIFLVTVVARLVSLYGTETNWSRNDDPSWRPSDSESP